MKPIRLSRLHPAVRFLVSVAMMLGLFFSAPARPTRADDDGYALAFDGVNDLVELDETAQIMASTWTTTKTVEVWVKPEGAAVTCSGSAVAACDYIFGDKPEWWGITRGIISDLDRIWVYSFDGSMDQIGVPYTPGEWVHIALVHGGGMLRAYKNGVEVTAMASGATQQPSTGAHPVLFVGGSIFHSGRNYTLQGQIDELRIWNIARSAAEINADMRRLLSGSEAGLAAYYQMSNGSGLYLTDDSVNNWNGTLLDGGFGVPPNGLPPQWVASAAFDILAPSVTINQSSSQADPTNLSAITFDVFFSQPVTGFTASDVDLSASSAPGALHATVGGSGTTYTVSVSGMTGSGTIVASIPAGAAQNASALDNSASTSTDNSVIYDNIPPGVIISQASGQADPTHVSPVTFQVLFSEAVSDFSSADVSLSGSAGATSASVSGSGTTYIVSVSGMTASGTVVASIPAGAAHDTAGNPNSASSSSDNTVTYDITLPTVSINQAPGQVDPTNTAPVTFQVLFSEAVSDFSSTDVSLSGGAGATIISVSGNGTTYTVSVSGMTASGTVVVSIPAGAAHDTAGNPNSASSSSDNTITYDVTPPMVTINQAPGQADPTHASPVVFQVLFSEAVSDFTGTDVALSGSAGANNASVTGSGATYTVSVSGMTGNGTVVVSIPAGIAHDAAGNANSASSSSDNTITYDVTPPTVTIDQSPGQADPTHVSPVAFQVLFSEAVSDFTGTDIALSGSAGATSASVTGSGTAYTVSVSGMTASGTVVASVPAGVAHDAAGNANVTSTSSDKSVTYDNLVPSVTINQAPGQADPTHVSPVNFQVLFSEAVSDFSSADVTLSGSAGANSASVSGSGATYTVSVSGMTTSGTVVASIPAGAAHDAAGNPNSASSSSDNTVTYDVTYPTVSINQAPGQADPTNTAPVTFQVLFSEAVSDFSSTDVSLSGGAGATIISVSGNGTTYTVSVSGMTASGTVAVSIPAGAAHDTAGNPSSASSSTDNSVIFDNIPPGVTISQSPGQADPTSASPVTFQVLFSEAVNDFTGTDVALSGSAGATSASVTGSGATYTVSVSGMTGSGTVVVSIPAGIAHDAAGNANSASSGGDNRVDFIYLHWYYLPIVTK